MCVLGAVVRGRGILHSSHICQGLAGRFSSQRGGVEVYEQLCAEMWVMSVLLPACLGSSGVLRMVLLWNDAT